MHRDDWTRHLAALGGADAEPFPPDQTLFDGDRGEQRLWRACRDTPHAGPAVAREVLGSRSGPLLSKDAFLAIEVWTECELAALHALHRLAREAADRSDAAGAAALTRRIAEATAWHLEHTQPDNATNRPWAVHVFLLSGPGADDAEAYAGTLLHNMSATEARDERLSKWILADAARELRHARC